MAETIQPVVMVGATRSGKSVVAKILERTGQYALMLEPVTVWDIGRRRGADDARGPEEATPEVVERIRRELFRRARRYGSLRIVDDLPHHAFRIPFVKKVLPEARFIMVTRDVRSTLPEMLAGWQRRDTLSKVIRRRLGGGNLRSIKLSKLPGYGFRWLRNKVRVHLGLKKVSWGPTAPGQPEFARTHSLIETAAYQWSSMVRHTLSGLRTVVPGEALTVRFEDLYEDRDRAMAGLAAFCGLAQDELLIAADAAVPEKPKKEWRDLTEEEWRMVWPMVGDLQKTLGYDDMPDVPVSLKE